MDDAWVNDYVGVPYVVNGRDRNGWDCWGLLMVVFREQRGLELPAFRVDPRRDKFGELAEAVAVISRSIGAMVNDGRMEPLAGPEQWAILTVKRARLPNHVALMVGHRLVLHCSERTRGTVCEPLQHFIREHGAPSYLRWNGG